MSMAVGGTLADGRALVAAVMFLGLAGILWGPDEPASVALGFCTL